MFTGLVECMGQIRSVKRKGGILEFSIAAPMDLSDSRVGDSICVQGVCLTMVGTTVGSIEVEVSRETLERTTLGTFGPGRRVNLERALRVSDRLGGHLVTGHVDGVGRLLEKRCEGPNVSLRFQAEPGTARYLVEKGSICVDGVSLTLGVCKGVTFTVHLIPHTLNRTTLQSLEVGDPVNLEADLIGKYVEKLLAARGRLPEPEGGVNKNLLAKAGFLAGPGE